MNAAEFLPVIFVGLMGLSMLLYAILDGYDLGVGMLFAGADDAQRDRMIASIGPFWDANETWLVLGVGILLVAFPAAPGVILGALYLPVTIMLFGLIARGVAFDFRAKARDAHKQRWDRTFCLGSLVASFAQGYMLGQFILGFTQNLATMAFSALIGLCVCAAYILIGACWLIYKTEDALQLRAIQWAKRALGYTALGVMLVSGATPLLSPRIFEKWFSFPNIILLAPVPMVTAGLFVAMWVLLRRLPRANDTWAWAPYAITVAIAVLCFHGLAFSFFPYIVPEQLTIWQAASSTASLWVILIGAVLVLPMILAYTFFTYRVFSGKATDLRYD